MKICNAVVVGCGAIAPLHLNSIEKSENACIYGVCDIRRESREQFVKKYGCKEFDSFDEVLNDTNVDSVHICTPHYLHATMLVEAVRSGKIVVVEKPLAMNLEEYEHAKTIVEKCNIPVCGVIQNRYNNCIMHIKEIINEGKYGRVNGVKGFITWNRPPEYYLNSDWRGKWSTEGGGLVINQALHTLDLLCYLGGKPEYIKATADTRLLNDVIEVEDTAEATIYLENGVLAHFYGTNAYSTNSSYDIEVNFERCSLRYIFGKLYLIQNNEIKVIDEDIVPTHNKSYWGLSHETLINNFYSSLAGKGGDYTDFNDSLLSVSLVDGLYKSVKTEKKIKIEI